METNTSTKEPLPLTFNNDPILLMEVLIKFYGILEEKNDS